MLRTRFVLLTVLLAVLLTACDSGGGEVIEGELEVTDIIIGDGAVVEEGHTIAVRYIARLADGSVFDVRGEEEDPFVFTIGVGMVIEGWDEGLLGVREGGVRTLFVPAHLAFGSQGQCFGDGTCLVPPNTAVEYDVTVEYIMFDVIVEDERVGTGRAAEVGSQLEVDYVGLFLNGNVFDSSDFQGQPIRFVLGSGQVIQGWDQGLVGIREGGVRILTIPPHLAYGQFRTGSIPAYSTLRFRVELLQIID